jgi:hypothetical protein
VPILGAGALIGGGARLGGNISRNWQEACSVAAPNQRCATIIGRASHPAGSEAPATRWIANALAVPRGPREAPDINGLARGLGENTTNDIQELSGSLPKPLSLLSAPLQEPDLVVDGGDLPATARELRDVFAASGRFFD